KHHRMYLLDIIVKQTKRTIRLNYKSNAKKIKLFRAKIYKKQLQTILFELSHKITTKKRSDSEYIYAVQRIQNLDIVAFEMSISINHNNKKKVDKRYTLKLVDKDIPWLYWNDFEVASDPNLSFDLFNQNNEITTNYVPSSRVILVEEEQWPSDSTKATAKILEHLVRVIDDEQSFCFALAAFDSLKAKLCPTTLQNVGSIPASTEQIYQTLFMGKVWSELKVEQWLSSKQLFVIVKILAKDKLNSVVMQSISDSLRCFALKNSKDGTPFDKFRLIPCVNYLELSKWIIDKPYFIKSFEPLFQKIKFQNSEVQPIDANDLIEVLTFGLELREDKTFIPTHWMEDHLIGLLQNHNHLVESTLQLLFDNTKCDKAVKANLWKRLWNNTKCWTLFQSLYKTQFEIWKKFISNLQQYVSDFADIPNLLQGFQSEKFQELVMESPAIINAFLNFIQEQECMCVNIRVFVCLSGVKKK
ncbi:hypothetical protein RFI_10618, partial [Reticulomyxa filosa]